jgi:cysteine dioxygenase
MCRNLASSAMAQALPKTVMIDRPVPLLSLPCRPTAAPLSDALADLLHELDRHPGTPTLSEVRRSLQETPLDLADVLPHTASDRGTYVRTRIHATDRYEVLAMCWLPGQLSPVHDHGGSSCGVRVIQGAATETVYRLGPDGLADPVVSRVFHPGEMIGAANDDLHTLGNLPVPGHERWPVALVTLHVYAPALRNSRKYVRRDASVAVAQVA